MHEGRLPENDVARLLQSALVHGEAVWQAVPVQSYEQTHVHVGRVPENDVARLLQSALVHGAAV